LSEGNPVVVGEGGEGFELGGGWFELVEVFGDALVGDASGFAEDGFALRDRYVDLVEAGEFVEVGEAFGVGFGVVEEDAVVVG